ncbi:MAG TPA: hypothetical protein DF966_10710, partial [Sulfitobacter sp.]|nr:hypothetical protein [Sulfitobacter sp.]
MAPPGVAACNKLFAQASKGAIPPAAQPHLAPRSTIGHNARNADHATRTTKEQPMHDIKAIRENPDAFDAALARRGDTPV